MGHAAGYVVAVLFGVVVGATEIAYRYRDSPGRSVLQPGGIAYTLVNGAASGGALYVIRAFGWTFGAHGRSSVDLLRVLVAGLGAVALFRTKLFSAATKGGETFSWGPSRLLEQLLAISDTVVDRKQAEQRSRDVAEIMSNVSFDKAHSSLPTYALGLLENTSADEQARLAQDVGALLQDQTMSDELKSQQLGVALIRLTGPDLLRQAVTALGASIASHPNRAVAAQQSTGWRLWRRG
jgi:hypothetical protein